MRAEIISEINGSFKKLVWVEECSGGIYVGFYGAGNKVHFSYHQDGTMHLNLNPDAKLNYYYSRDGDEVHKDSNTGHSYAPMGKNTPIKDIEKFIQITVFGLPLEESYEVATDDYIKSKSANAIIYLNPEIIKRQRVLNIIPCIVRKGFEKDCIEHFNKSYQSSEVQAFELLNANFFKLNQFKDFLIGILLSGGK